MSVQNKSIDNIQIRIRTGINIGSTCHDYNTNCRGVLNDGRVVWDNCNNWQSFAGKYCKQTVNLNGGGTCYKC